MILSEKWKLVFIKGEKVAGTSLEMALSSVCSPTCIVTPIAPYDELHRLSCGIGAQNYSDHPDQERQYLDQLRRLGFAGLAQAPPREIRMPKGKYYNHMPLREVLAHHGEFPSDYTVLGIERSPYRKVISWANMQLSYHTYNAQGAMTSGMDNLISFLGKAIETPQIKDVFNLPRDLCFDGTLGMTRMLRYESLSEDFESLKRDLGLPSGLILPHAKKGLLSNELEISKLFKPEHIRRINETFAAEFAAFDYEMIEA